MKTKFSKILGVGLTLVMVLALTAGFALPAGASPDENAWSRLAYPAEGEVGGFFYDETITEGPGPIAQAIDGTLYAYVEIGAGVEQIVKSTDGGHSWALTLYSDATYGVAGETVVAIACSSIDADIVYVADEENVYKTADAGDNFAAVAAASLPAIFGVGNENITSLAVGYLADDSPFVFFGTEDDTDTTGHVYYINEEAYGASWTDLQIAAYDVYGLAVSPDFASDTLVVVVAASGAATFVGNNYGVVGDWTYEELLDDTPGGSFVITEASDPVFPEDFDATDAYELFVGVVGAAHTTSGDGGVYRVYDVTYSDLLSYADADIISLDLVGEVGNTMLLAGVNDVVDIWYSTNDGDNWKNAVDYGVAPSGVAPVCVLMDDDFASNDTAWAATSGAEGAVSLSVDGGVVWHGVSLIHTDIDSVVGVALSPAYATDETLFLLTNAATEDTESVLKYDGANWVRIFESTLYGATTNDVDLVAVSPDFATDETAFIGCTGSEQIFRSTDTGNSFAEQRVEPAAITAWTIIDSDTIIAGGSGTIYKTEAYGRRAWSAYAITGAGAVSTFAVVGETIMVGDAAGAVFVSEDAGETWEQVGDAPTDLGSTAAILIASDGTVIYGASSAGTVIGRCIIDTGEDWADQTWEAFSTDTLAAASGTIISPDGTLYVFDADPGDGVQRALNPTEADETDVVFEKITYKLRTTAELALAGFSVGSNFLWATNAETGAEAELWVYEDGLATEVILNSPMNATAVNDTDEATLEWFELTGAQEYEVDVNTRDDFLGTAIVVADTELEWAVADGLDPGTTYYWRVRVALDDPLLSRWSETRTFISALARPTPPAMWFPDIGADDVTRSPTFSWDEVVGATSYKITVATEPGFSVTSRLVETMITTNFYPCEVSFAYNTTYYWRVKAYSDSVVVSEWTSGMFTTMAKPVPVTPPVEVTVPPAADVTVEVPPAVEVIVPAAQVISPTWIYVIIAVGAVLAIAVIVLIVRTRRVS